MVADFGNDARAVPPGGETRRLKKKLYTSIMKRTIT
jgi:hypothetical protein